MGDYALELSLADDDEAAVVAQWQALRAAGLPSQADHRTMTNAPHCCLVVARTLPLGLASHAAGLLGPLLPTPLAVRGLLVLGEGPRVTLAHLVEPAPDVAAAVDEVRRAALAAGAPVRHPVWTPHVTLARRVPRTRVPDAWAALAAAPAPRALAATRLRWWDPDTGAIDTIASA